MSEQPGATSAPVTTSAPTTAPASPTADELAAARALLESAGELGAAAGPAASVSDLAGQALADGAEAAEVDPAQLLKAIQQLQAKVDALETEKRTAGAPDVVKLTTALADHLTAKAVSVPALSADPDSNFGPGLEAAADAKEAASTAAASESPDDATAVATAVGKVATWVERHAARHPSLDYSYIRDLISEAIEAAHKLAG